MYGALGRRHGDWIRRLAATVHCYDSLLAMATTNVMECCVCDKKIDGNAESASARYVQAGFCDECIQSRSLEHTEISRSLFERRAYSFKEHPVLSDIDWDVAEVLKYSLGQENDAIALALVKQCTQSVLKEARFDLLCMVIYSIHEGQILRNIPLSTFRKSKRCDNINKCASDIVDLFRYVSCLSDEVPSCLLNKTAPPSYETATGPIGQSDTAHAQIDLTEMCNQSLRKPIPQPRLHSTPDSTPSNSKSSTPSTPPPPPSRPLQSNHKLSDSTEYEESLRLYLNATPGPNSVSLGETTWKLYPKTPHPTPGNATFAFDKTPFHLRYNSANGVTTSSPLNAQAPAFFPPDFMIPPSMPTLQTTNRSANRSHESEMEGIRDLLDIMQSEIRHLTATVKTYKGFVDEYRRLLPLNPPERTEYNSNWAEAQALIDQLNTELAASPPQMTIIPDEDLIQFSPFNPRDSKLNAPPTSSSGYDETKQDLPKAMVLMQREFEWMVGHVAGQDQKLLDLEMELGNLKQDIQVQTRSNAIPPPSTATQSQIPPTGAATCIIPPPAGAPGSTDTRPQPYNPYTAAQPEYTIPTSNRFEGLTAEDADIYMVDPTSQSTSKPTPVKPKPAPRPKPVPRNSTAPQNAKPVPKPRPRRAAQRRPKVRTVGSSMVANQAKHQTARGLDAVAHAHSGEKAEQIQDRVLQDTTDDDEYIVLAGGTNNVPKDDVAGIIGHMADLIDFTRALRPSQHIIVPQLLHRYNSRHYASHNEKADKVNKFLKHKCTKNSRMHYLPLTKITRGDLYDNLHLDYVGKDKYAEAVADLVFRIESDTA